MEEEEPDSLPLSIPAEVVTGVEVAPPPFHQITRDLSPLKASLKGRFTAGDKLGARLRPNIN